MNSGDPFVVGRAVGAAIFSAALAFVVARRLAGPSGSAELERLKRVAGVGDKGSIARLRARDWLPWIASPAVGLLVFAFMMVSAGVGRVTVADLPRLRTGFVDGCTKQCELDNDDSRLCRRVCECGLERVREHVGTDQALLDWFYEAERDPTVNQDMQRATDACTRAIVGKAGG